MEEIIKSDALGAFLKEFLAVHRNERVVVLGTTCCGKSTLIQEISEARDMDEEIFPLLTPEEAEYVCQDPWTPEIGETMNRWVRERLVSIPGRPFFGTVYIDCDRVVFLKMDLELLKERCAKRGVDITNALAMQKEIEETLPKDGVERWVLHVTP